MRLLLASLIVLSIQSWDPFETIPCDEVKIYLFTEYLTIGIGDACGWNEDKVRVNASIKISITDKNEIEEIKRRLIHIKPNAITSTKPFICQMVVDFVSKNRIKKTISFSSLGEVRLDEDRHNRYKLENGFAEFFDQYIAFFRQVND